MERKKKRKKKIPKRREARLVKEKRALSAIHRDKKDLDFLITLRLIKLPDSSLRVPEVIFAYNKSNSMISR